MDFEKESEPLGDQSSRNELVLDNWKLILIFFVGLVICVIFFAAGLIVGRHQPRVAETVQAPGESATRSERPAQGSTAESRSGAPPASGETVVDLRERPDLPTARETAPPPLPSSESAEEVRVSEVPVVGTDQAAPPPTAGPAPAKRIPETPSTGYRVQIAALKSPEEAQIVVNKLQEKGFKAFVVPPADDQDVYYRVQMGDYPDRATAQEVILKLRQIGEKPMLKRP